MTERASERRLGFSRVARSPTVNEPFVSVIVPVLNDAVQLDGLLSSLHPRDDAEIIVVNGAPADPAIAGLRARFPHVQWTNSSPGRGRQMNHGSAKANGRWLLFLHADGRLSPGWIDEVRRADRGECSVGGSFRLVLDSAAASARLIEWGVALRVRWFGLSYGDQALFVRRDVFEALGGYRPLLLMEDVDLVRRLRRAGRLMHSDLALRVSARRWERNGWARCSAENMMLVLLFLAGVAPERLARVYHRGVPHDSLGPRDRIARPESRIPNLEPRTPTRLSRITNPESQTPSVAVIIPVLNEEPAIGAVLSQIPDLVRSVTVVDNGSTDATAERAQAAGARVVYAPRRGYGRACRAGLDVNQDADIIVFLDGDLSDYPDEMKQLVDPILKGEADFVLGARSSSGRPLHARAGTEAYRRLINRIWGTAYQDLGPFRAIRRTSLDQLGMKDATWGWTIEMQVKAAEAGLRIREIPVRQRKRIGRSKISGTIVGTARAGPRMLATIVGLWRTRGRRLRVPTARA